MHAVGEPPDNPVIACALKRFDWTRSTPTPSRGVAKRLSGNTQGGDLDIASAKQLQADIADEMAKQGVSIR